MRVRVPFGRQRLVGVVHSLAAESELPRDKLKAVLEVIDAEPVLDAQVMQLLEWAAQYYHHPLGEVIAAALPRLAREGAPSRASTERWFATEAGRTALEARELGRAPRQRELLEALVGGGVGSAALAEKFADWRTPMRALVTRGFACSAEEAEASPPDPDATALLRGEGPRLSEEQAAAVKAIDEASGRFAPFLLYGITGSGKTEVYLHTVEHALRSNRRALVLVPEIGLTPQLVGRFRERFAVPMAVLHSALTDSERLAAWRQCLSGEARVVLGTRSAVFAPSPISASSSSTKSTTRPSSSTKAAFAIRRVTSPSCARSASARPSCSDPPRHRSRPCRTSSPGNSCIFHCRGEPGRRCRRRAAVVDLREHAVRQGISTPAVEAMQRHLADDGQVLVFINRRGYSPTSGLHRLWMDRAVPRLRCAAHRASRRLTAALPPLRRRRTAARELPAVRLRGEARRSGHRARGGDARETLPDHAHRAAGPRRGAQARRPRVGS
jgi:primosomal protein N' (replication factor Y)